MSLAAGEADAFRWLFGFVRPHGARLGAVLGLSVAASGLVLLQPYLTKLIIDDGLLAKDVAALVFYALLLLGAGFLGTAISGLNRLTHTKLSGLVLFALREAVYRHVQTLSPAFLGKMRTGDVLSRIDGDVAELQRFSVDGLLAFVNGVLALCGAVALMLWLSWELSLLAAILLPAEFLFLRFIRPLIADRTRALRERSADVSSFLVETLGAMKFIQSVGAEAREAKRLGALGHAFVADLMRLQVVEFFAAAVPGMLTAASRAVVFLVGGYWFIQGQMPLGSVIAFSTYLGMAVGPVQTLLGLYVGLQRMRVSLTRVKVLTEAAPDINRPAQPRELPTDGKGEIRIEGVSFRYPGDDELVLDNVDVVFPAGAKIGVGGASGAGKTTLIDLLQRHYDPTVGRITLDGTDLRDIDIADLRRRVAVVAQDVVLFRGSVADNIRYARPDATDAELRDAAERAQIADFIESQPQGYDTPIGERGARLSGGQRQRLAIARALLQRPLVLILDEATSAVDRPAEALLMAEVDRLFDDCTRIVISHRDDLIANSDMLVRVDAGRMTVVGPGT